MASVSNDPNGRRRVLFVAPDGSRKAIRLGKMSQRDADAVKVKVEALVTAAITGNPPADEVSRWVASRDAVLKSKLAAVGLIEASTDQTDPTLIDFVDKYIAARTDVKRGTRNNYGLSRDWLQRYFKNRRLSSITVLDAEQWRSWLLNEGHAENYVRTLAKNAKLFGNAAVKAELLAKNPFRVLRSALQPRPDRMRFVTLEETQRLLDVCPNADWRCLVALCRYGGLRSPSETLLLQWTDINWEFGTMFVRSPKTARHPGGESRIVPLFPELRDILWDAHDRAPERTEFVIHCSRDSVKNFRTRFRKIIQRAGMVPWDRPFQNLRSSRESELAAAYPLASVTKWLGNSPEIAMQHYLQPVNTDFERAVSNRTSEPETRGAKSGAVSARNGRNGKEGTTPLDSSNPSFSDPFNLTQVVAAQGLARTGVEPVHRFRDTGF